MMNGGGLIHFDYQLCTALARAGADVTLVTGTDYELASLPHNFKAMKMLKLWKGFADHPVSAELNFLRRSIGKIFWNMRRVVRGARMLMAWVKLTFFLLRLKPDLVQFSRLEYPFESFFISLLKRGGFVLSQICHEFEEREAGGVLSNILHKLDLKAYLSFSAIFFLSDDSRRRFFLIHPIVNTNLSYSIPHGNSEWLLDIQDPPEVVNLRDRYGIKVDERVILFFGLLAPSKGVEDLIKGFKLAIKSCTAKLVIAGYPTKHVDAAKINSLVSSYGIEESVILDLRYVPLNELGALMDLATVVVYPYRSSTQSGSLQTAYTFGKPVIATNVGGLPEVVEDGKSGFLIPAGSPAALAEKISMVMNKPVMAAEMGQYARMLSITRFGWDSIARKMMDVYDDICRDR